MMKRIVGIVFAGAILYIGIGAAAASAGETDVLLQKLVEKGILSSSEAQEIKSETSKEMAKIDKQKEEDYKKLAKDSMPDWVKNTKLKGDFRFRYEWTKDKSQQDNSRERIRVRIGEETKINDQAKVGIGIATGKPGDPRSRNVTLGTDNSGTTNTPASSKNIVLDYAYATYAPVDWASLTLGKFQNPLWLPYPNNFWKDDITPEGLAANFNYELTPSVNLFMNDMFFILKNDGRPTSTTHYKEPIMVALQPGANWAVDESTNLKAATTFYYFNLVKGQPPFTNWSSTNTLDSSGNYMFNYNSISPSAELGFKQPFDGFIPYVALFGDGMYNVSSMQDTTFSGRSGFATGVKFGDEKVSDWKQWQTKFIFSRIGRDAWMDIFTDPDRYAGKTNSQALQGMFDFGVGKNSWLRLNYFYATSLTKDTATQTKLPEQLLQLDWNFKW